MTTPGKTPGEDSGKGPAVRRWRTEGPRLLLLLAALVLAWFALRGVAWAEAWRLLAGLGPAAILIILALNLVMLPVMTARWWLLLKTLGSPVGLPAVCGYRCGANAVSYLTPGPHFGGEPLLVYLLHKRHGIPLTTATTSVALDRLLELSASMAVFTLCLVPLSSVGGGFFVLAAGWELALVIAAAAACAAFQAALFSGGKPCSRLFSFLGRRFDKTGRFLEGVRRGETMAEALFRRNRRQFILANLLSLCHWLTVFAEFWLMAYLLGFSLSFGHLAAVVLVTRLAFLTPFPAGIGVLESALPWLTVILGLGGAPGLSLCLIIRFRDALFSLAGLFLTANIDLSGQDRYHQ